MSRRLRGAIRRRAAVVCLLALAGGSTPAPAKNLRGVWYFGGNLFYHTTRDSLISNAADPADPRPADFLTRETSLEDGVAYGLTAGFGLTDWLSLQLDAGYHKGSLGPVDAYTEARYPVAGAINPNALTLLASKEESIPFSGGDLTQIPVSLSAVLRFRKDRPLNPFLSAGYGRLFLSFDADDEVAALNARMAAMRITRIDNEQGIEITPARHRPFKAEGRVPSSFPLSVRVQDSDRFDLRAGMEYALTGRMGLVVNAGYVFVSEPVKLDLAGQDEVILSIFPEELFREDGSLRLFNSLGGHPNPRVNPSDPNSPFLTCPKNTTDDFDNDGNPGDLCYDGGNPNFVPRPSGMFLVQGGELDLSGYDVHIGLRFYF
ncbi:MAG TPA: outer membrane beta-barrel protein [Candidatus Polarisedimenticolia bacterium]|nr:outer membrane beta-barrel protein [Candidatus Polarisedimenticolia bacterium]